MDLPPTNSYGSKLPLMLLYVLPTILFIVLGTVSLVLLVRPAATPKFCSCGKNIAETKTIGCKFDSLNLVWLPEHFRDDGLTKRFEREGPGVNGE